MTIGTDRLASPLKSSASNTRDAVQKKTDKKVFEPFYFRFN